ncbi:hypothetical protein BG011_009359 [Mortierella polycephala]|uniref:SUN domain-containing protein n=1 Tax=Mortierella polycephala TaxID=41804 RepID=A0A9P6QC79_9FUNG|nr:hypothetical protein BG011_009359 [Mortierella polycephala]
MAPLTPSRSRISTGITLDESSPRRDYLSTPIRGPSRIEDPPLYTTVDNLLLPGVIGTTVQGPKTPIRSPIARRVNTNNYFQNTNDINVKYAHLPNNTSMSTPSPRLIQRPNSNSIRSPQQQLHQQQYRSRGETSSPPPPWSSGSGGNRTPSRYVDAETLVENSSMGTGSGTRDMAGDQTPQRGKKYRSMFRPHDTPIRKRYNSQEAAQRVPISLDLDIDQDDDDDDDDEEEGEVEVGEEVEDDPEGQHDFDHMSHHHHHHRHHDYHDDADMDEENDDNLDIGDYGDEVYAVEHHVNSGSGRSKGEEEEEENVYPNENIIVQQLERKKEKEQLSFIKRWTRVLMQQRDELGWGTPMKDRQQQHLPIDTDNDDDSDSGRSLTSARVRRAEYRRRSPTLLKVNRKIPSPAPSALQVGKASTPHAILDSPKNNPFNVPKMSQMDSGIGLGGSQEWHDGEYAEAIEEADEQSEDEYSRPLARRSTSPWLQRADHRGGETEDHWNYESQGEEEQAGFTDYETDVDRRSSYGLPSNRYQSARQYYTEQELDYPLKAPPTAPAQQRVYPWHVVWRAFVNNTRAMKDLYDSILATLQIYLWMLLTWIHSVISWPWMHRQEILRTGETWIDAGVSSGLLSSGTLIGVALLALAVWGGNSLNFKESNMTNGHNGANATAVQFPRGPMLKERVSSVWSSIRWHSSPKSGEDDNETGYSQWREWIPQVPSVNDWIPFRTSKNRNKILIPADKIESFEDLKARIDIIQGVLSDLKLADDNMDENMGKTINSLRKELRKELKTQFDSLSDLVSDVEKKLDEVTDEVESLKEYVKHGNWINQTVLELIHDELPQHLVVSRDPESGKLSIPGEFWDTARELFMTSAQVQGAIEDRGKKQGKVAGWNDFLQENERAMSVFVEDHMSAVTRSAFLDLVKTEANLIWQGLERNVVALLEKQGKLQGRNAPQRTDYGSPSTTARAVDNRPLTDVERELITGLIDEALDKYSADVLAKPDYAVHSAGGRIIPKLTSPSYNNMKPTWFGRWVGQYLVRNPRKSNPVSKVIEPGLGAGDCWAMEGQEGQLGIRLARKIIVTEVTVEHAGPGVAFDAGTAPREIEIWSLRDGKDVPEKEEEEKEAEQQKEASASTDQGDGWWRSGAPWPKSIYLATIEYAASTSTTSMDQQAVSKPKLRQTFSIPLSKQTTPSVGVAVRIKSNWGHPNHTCLYRIRVHGYEPSSAAKDGSL